MFYSLQNAYSVMLVKACRAQPVPIIVRSGILPERPHTCLGFCNLTPSSPGDQIRSPARTISRQSATLQKHREAARASQEPTTSTSGN